MTVGRILVSDDDGHYLLKFSGDVRVTLCGSLNRHMEMIFGSQLVTQVVVDMLEAECLDSTTLGLTVSICRFSAKTRAFCEHWTVWASRKYLISAKRSQ
jgi:anti-anti-sigma regulatory factor